MLLDLGKDAIGALLVPLRAVHPKRNLAHSALIPRPARKGWVQPRLTGFSYPVSLSWGFHLGEEERGFSGVLEGSHGWSLATPNVDRLTH